MSATVRDLEQQTVRRIVAEREHRGAYGGLDDFISRTGITKEQLILLIRLGAFRFTGKSKPVLLWEAHMLLTGGQKSDAGPRLFSAASKTYQLPSFEQQQIEDAYDEIELLGFPVTCSLFDMLKTSFRGELKARELGQHVGEKVRMTGQLVTIKYVRTVNRQMMHFATFLDAGGEFFETVHFPKVSRQWPFRGHGIYLIGGRIVSEFGHPSIEVEKMAPLPLRGDPRGLGQ